MTDLDAGQLLPVAGVRLRAQLLGRLRAYLALTKPRIIELLLVTTLPAMILAARGWPSTGLVLVTMTGGAFAAGGANALNCYLDRDIDAVMRRTAGRPLNGDRVSPIGALGLGLSLSALATGLLWWLTNPLATALTVLAIAVYVLGYTMLLKRRTSANIVWGGSAGCMPTLIGWAAVTGHLALAPFLLFAVVFFWTPPHFWALAIRFRADYAAAGVPMLPVVASLRTVVNQMTVYTWLTVVSSLLLWPIARTGLLYPIAAAVLGAGFLREVSRLRARLAAGLPLRPMRVFHVSITYLSALFLALAADVLIASWSFTGAAAGAVPAGQPVVGSLHQDGVAVTVRWAAGSADGAALRVTFTPDRPGYHLYSTDLPDHGVDGVGRPTRVELGPGLSARGPARSDVHASPLSVPGVSAPLPVYPPGPVVLTQPVTLTPAAGRPSGRPIRTWVTFAACSRTSCLPPVVHRELDLVLPTGR